jgi:homoserine dehydrogenase
MHDGIVTIGMLGCGIVGSGTVRTLLENAGAIRHKIGADLRLKRICVRDLHKPRPEWIDRSLLTNDPALVLDDPEIDIVAELMGGIEPARTYLQRAIANGKHIVTANKELIAKHGHQLLVDAADRHLDFGFEGSVAGGIPIIQAMKIALAANRIFEVIGIVNGTTNYILTRMTQDGLDFDAALAEARHLGYAEADPTDDVDAYDAAYKLAILAAIAFQSRVALEDVYHEGIRRITPRDIEYARELGYVIKLLAIAKQVNGAMELRVHPAMLRVEHPLAAVNDVHNAIYVRGNAVGEVMFYGRGAGSLPTGSSVAADLMETARNLRFGATSRISCTCFDEKPAQDICDVRTNYYIRMRTTDRPKVLATVAAILGDHDVSIESVVQKRGTGDEAEIAWVTHQTREGNLREALARIVATPNVIEISSCIRVEE